MNKSVVLKIDIILLIFSIILCIVGCVQKYMIASYVNMLNVLVILYFIKKNL